jgi:hypothetical protein
LLGRRLPLPGDQGGRAFGAKFCSIQCQGTE